MDLHRYADYKVYLEPDGTDEMIKGPPKWLFADEINI